MTRYFGVKCATCNAEVPLAECKPMEGTKITFYVVPAEPVSCRVCGASHSYTSVDSAYFDGPDGLIARRRGDRGVL